MKIEQNLREKAGMDALVKELEGAHENYQQALQNYQNTLKNNSESLKVTTTGRLLFFSFFLLFGN